MGRRFLMRMRPTRLFTEIAFINVHIQIFYFRNKLFKILSVDFQKEIMRYLRKCNERRRDGWVSRKRIFRKKKKSSEKKWSEHHRQVSGQNIFLLVYFLKLRRASADKKQAQSLTCFAVSATCRTAIVNSHFSCLW